jgi:hypothetical protein
MRGARQILAALLLSSGVAAAARPPDDELAVRVGKTGYVTRADFDKALKRHAHKANKAAADLTPAERKVVLRELVGDEVLFLSALRLGIFKKYPDLRKRLIIEHQDRIHWGKKDRNLDPKAFSADEVRAFYDTHKARFTLPPGVQLEIYYLPHDIDEGDVAAHAKAIQKDPGSVKWDHYAGSDHPLSRAAYGTARKGEPRWTHAGTTLIATYNSDARKKEIFAMKKGEVGAVVTHVGAMRSILRVVDTKKAELLPFDKVELDARRYLANHLRSQTKAERTDAEWFREAVAADAHRRPGIRKAIINYFVSSEKLDRNAVVEKYRKKWPIQVLVTL